MGGPEGSGVMKLAGKVALVTGAARPRGIGRGMVQALADEGAAMAVNDIAATASDGQAFVEELQAKGVRAAFYAADVSQRAEVDALIASIQADFGGLDIVCSNAGVADWKTVAETDDAVFDRIVAVNLTGAFNVGQAAARAMVAAGRGGRIILTSSVHAQMGFPTMSVYGATKSAMRALCESMAIELAPHGIRVNHIGPGWVLSQLNDPSPALASEEITRANLATIPIEGRAADPYELGRAAVYLASSDGDYVTGAYLRLDGGFVVGKY
jgi:NAD(P)-dependent dehydrogenase (short-subunit alcohol dehydrogenase family)